VGHTQSRTKNVGGENATRCAKLTWYQHIDIPGLKRHAPISVSFARHLDNGKIVLQAAVVFAIERLAKLKCKPDCIREVERRRKRTIAIDRDSRSQLASLLSSFDLTRISAGIGHSPCRDG